MVQCVFARNCRLARLTCVEHVSLCVGRSETIDYARDEFPKKSLRDGAAAAAAPSMAKWRLQFEDFKEATWLLLGEVSCFLAEKKIFRVV